MEIDTATIATVAIIVVALAIFWYAEREARRESRSDAARRNRRRDDVRAAFLKR